MANQLAQHLWPVRTITHSLLSQTSCCESLAALRMYTVKASNVIVLYVSHKHGWKYKVQMRLDAPRYTTIKKR